MTGLHASPVGQLNLFEGTERLWTLDVEQVVLRPAATSLRWAFEEYAPTSLMTGTWAETDARLREREQRNQWQRWRVLSCSRRAPISARSCWHRSRALHRASPPVSTKWRSAIWHRSCYCRANCRGTHLKARGSGNAWCGVYVIGR